MSNDNTIGDFRVKLNVETNKDSFTNARSALDGIGDGVVRLLGTVRNAVPLIADTLGQISEIAGAEGSLAVTATYLGLNTDALEKWRVAAKIAGADANGLTSEMQKLQRTFNAMNEGEVDEGLATKLSYLGLNYMQIKNMDSDKRMQTILEAAKAMKDQSWASDIVSSIYGSNAAEMLNNLNTQKQSVEWLLSKASGVVFTNDESKMKGLGFSTEWQTTLSALEHLKALFGAEMADRITPMLEKLNDWLTKNGPAMIGKITEIIDSMTELINTSVAPELKEFFTTMAGNYEFSGNQIQNTLQTAKNVGGALKEGDTEAAKQAAITGYAKSQVLSWQKKYDIDDFDTAKNQYASYLDIVGQLDKKTNGGKNKININDMLDLSLKYKILGLPGGKDNFKDYIYDGIVAPGGHVTHVAPDDWVFAMRDIGALASAFMPKGTGTGSASFVINQTFNVQNGMDLGETIRQQAERGTTDGLSQALQRNQIRMALMPSLA